MRLPDAEVISRPASDRVRARLASRPGRSRPEASTTVEVKLADTHAPALDVQLDIVGSAPRTQDNGQPDPKLPRRPAYAMGTISLPVPPRARTLKLSLKPGADKLEPGGSTTLEVTVKDASDQPVRGSEVAVVVVDEAVLALGGLDVLVCNAASNPYYGPMSGITDEAFAKILSNNIISNNTLVNLVSPQMVQRKDGAIIIISSPTSTPTKHDSPVIAMIRSQAGWSTVATRSVPR